MFTNNQNFKNLIKSAREQEKEKFQERLETFLKKNKLPSYFTYQENELLDESLVNYMSFFEFMSNESFIGDLFSF